MKIFSSEKKLSTSALNSLADLIGKYHNARTVILIDEYDAPMLNSIGKKSAQDIEEFLTRMYGHALKDSRSAFSIITGTTRIIMDHVNNLIASTTFDKCFNNYGISEFELEKIIKEYCSVESLKSIEKWWRRKICKI